MTGGGDDSQRTIDAVVHEVNSVLVAADSRREIEAGVCDTLAESELYGVAWIGRYDASRDEVVPRVWAGVDGDSFDGNSIPVEGAAPASGAWQGAQLRGFESGTAVSLAADDVDYGVLNVSAERPHAFDDAERRLLSELAETVATAIAGVKARQSLEAERRKYRRLTERISDAYYAVDEAWRITYWNDRIATRTGIDAADAEGAVLWEVLPELCDTASERQYRVAMQTGEQRTFETYLDGPDGYWAEIDVYPDDEGLSVFSREITARKDRETELRQNRAFLERIQSVADIGGWQVDFRTDSLEWTDELYGIHGVSAEYEPALEEAIEFYHPDDRGGIRTAITAVRDDGEPYDMELRIVTADGETRWVRALGEPVYEAGSVVGARGTFQDITEQKQREADLREVTERLNLAVEGSNLGVWDWNVRTDTVTFNRQWAEMLGFSLDELEPTFETWEDRVHPADMEQVDAALSAHIQGETDRYASEHRVRTKDGDWKWVRDVGRVVERDAAGDPVRAVGIHTDVTDRVETRRALEAERDMFTQGPTVVFKWAPSDGWPVEYVSDNVAEVFGYTPDQLESGAVSYARLVHDDDIDRVMAEVEAHSDGTTERFSHDPYRMVTADGEVKWVTDNTKIIRDGGEITHYLGYLVDVTERKRTERKLQRQRDNLELLNEMVRHDIRNDLQVILMLAERITESTDAEAADRARTVVTRTENASELTQTARDLAETMLQTDDDHTPTALRPVLKRQIDETRSLTADVTVDSAGEIPTVDVLADEMLPSVFRNVFNNAVTHNDTADPTVAVSVTTDPDHVRIAAADDGPGVADGRKEAVFGRGEKGLESNGTGLGLYLVETLVSGYGGTAWVRDRDPGEFGIDGTGGAVFCIELPRA